MSKVIRITPDYLEAIKEQFNKYLTTAKIEDGRINFQQSLTTTNRKANLFFSEKAYLKMLNLVSGTDKEIAWHGITKRSEDETKDDYYIEDIMVYPQEVTGATVTTDQMKYQNWMMEQPDDIFNNIRMQGHSHVNMACSPSAVDSELYRGILEQLGPDAFYVFIIWNKRNEKYIRIYDMRKNIMFETVDITVSLYDEQYGLFKWLEDSKKSVTVRSFQPQTTYYSGYKGGLYGPGYNDYRTPATQPVKPWTPETTSKPPVKPQASKKYDKKNEVRKGRRSKGGSLPVVGGAWDDGFDCV